LKFILIIALVFVALQAYVRLMPTAAARWHVDPFAAADPAKTGGRLILRAADLPFENGAQALGAAQDQMLLLARTKRIAGRVEDGRITFVTRSKFWGFPDYTTIGMRAGGAGNETSEEGAQYQIAMLARQRFGLADMGVNMARLKRIAAALRGAQ
jgi:hypothetical protein